MYTVSSVGSASSNRPSASSNKYFDGAKKGEVNELRV